MIWCGGGGVLCASTWWDHRESNNLQHPVYNIRWQIRDSSPHQPIHFSNQHIKTMFLKHFSGLKKEDLEPSLTLRTNSFILFSYLSFIGVQWSFDIFWTENRLWVLSLLFLKNGSNFRYIHKTNLWQWPQICYSVLQILPEYHFNRINTLYSAINFCQQGLQLHTFVTLRPVATNTL